MSEQIPTNKSMQRDHGDESANENKKEEEIFVPWREYNAFKNNPLSKKEEDVLKKILEEEKEKFVPHEQYGYTTSPKFWRTVFVRFYGAEPNDDKDSRWDSLFTSGYQLLRPEEKK